MHSYVIIYAIYGDYYSAFGILTSARTQTISHTLDFFSFSTVCEYIFATQILSKFN